MTPEQLYVWLRDEAGWCGCGLPDEAAVALVMLLERCETHATPGAQREVTGPVNGVRYILLYWFDHLGLTEHGGSVDGSWLTDKGKGVLAALRVERDRDGFESLFDGRCACGLLVDSCRYESGDCRYGKEQIL